MVTIRPYTLQTQASGISQQNSGGNGYVGNAGMKVLGQALGNAAETALGIDEQSLRIQEKERQRQMQSDKIAAMSSLLKAERETLAKTEDLKKQSQDDLSGFTQKAEALYDETIGNVLQNIPQSQELYAREYALRNKQKFLYDADDYVRKTQVDRDVANVEDIKGHLLTSVNADPETLRQSIQDYQSLVQELGLPEAKTQKMIEYFSNDSEKKHLQARLNNNPYVLYDELKQKKDLTINEQKTFIAAEKAIEKINIKNERLMKEDAVQYALNNGGDVYDAFKNQSNLPVPLRKVLTNDYAEQAGLMLQNAQSVEDIQGIFDDLQQRVPEDLLPNALSQIQRDYKLPREYKTFLDLDPIKDSTEMRYLFDAVNSNKKDFNENFKIALKSKGYSQDDFNYEMTDTLSYISDIERKQGVSLEAIGDMTKTLQTLAASHYIKHGDLDGAVDFARKAYLKNYHNDGDELETVDGYPVLLPIDRVPNKKIAIDYLENYKEKNADNIYYVQDNQNMSLVENLVKQDIMDKAYYGLSEQGDGLVLFAENELMLLDKNKQPFKVKFTDINAQDVREAKTEKINKDAKSYIPSVGSD